MLRQDSFVSLIIYVICSLLSVQDLLTACFNNRQMREKTFLVSLVKAACCVVSHGLGVVTFCKFFVK